MWRSIVKELYCDSKTTNSISHIKMNIDMISVNDTEKRLVTIKQQIEKLKSWNKLQESRLMEKLHIKQNLNVNDCTTVDNAVSHEIDKIEKLKTDEKSVKLINNKREINMLDEQPLVPAHKDFQSLLDASLEESNCYATNKVKISNEKKPFLKKGEGLSRFRMKPEDFKLKKKNRTVKKNQSKSNKKSPKLRTNNPSHVASHTKKNSTLEAFEILEQKANDSSFCSSSSMIAQLMEDSIKSTPLKYTENTNNKQHVEELQQDQYEHHICGEYEFFGVRNLDVIDEEPSKLKDTTTEKSNITMNCADNEKYNLVIVDVQDENKYLNNSDDEHFDSSECSSKCSCCQDNSQYISKSVSFFSEETTTVYSPVKNESIRKIQFVTTDNIGSDSQTEHVQLINTENLDETRKNEYDLLKSMLQLRLREVETEIDAFRSENSHLSKLRDDYEKEYNKFCSEKVQFLAKIRAEHLKGIHEIEEEKKKLRREKISFEKYMKEVKNKPSKEEREEIRQLKEEIKKLKDEMNKKESRWAAAQARIRTEMKQLKDHNTTLKEELKELKISTKKVVTFPSITKKNKPNQRIQKNKEDESEILQHETLKPIIINYSNSGTSSLLKNTEFSRMQNLNDVRTITENLKSYESPIISKDVCKSVCVSTFLNEQKPDEFQSIDDIVTLSKNNNDESEVTELFDANGNTEKIYEDGRKEIWYSNGNVKKISADGKIIKTIYYNGDVKEMLLEKEIVKYYYAESNIWHTQYNDGFEIMEFPNGRIEKRLKDGSAEITYPNGTVYNESFSGEEKWTHVDGTVIINNKDKNEKKIVFTNGQIEIHTPDYKMREYPDGTIKIVYVDGNQETRYANGRVRLKAKDGRLLADSLTECDK